MEAGFGDFISLTPNKKKTIEEEKELSQIPWCQKYENVADFHPFSHLHNEILSFLNFISPTKQERERRSKV